MFLTNAGEEAKRVMTKRPRKPKRKKNDLVPVLIRLKGTMAGTMARLGSCDQVDMEYERKVSPFPFLILKYSTTPSRLLPYLLSFLCFVLPLCLSLHLLIFSSFAFSHFFCSYFSSVPSVLSPPPVLFANPTIRTKTR